MISLPSFPLVCAILFGSVPPHASECGIGSMKPYLPLCQGTFEEIRTTQEACSIVVVRQPAEGKEHYTIRGWFFKGSGPAHIGPPCLCKLNERWPGSVIWEHHNPCTENV